MKAEGEGTSALATSQGAANANAAIDLSAVPEAPIAGKPAAPATQGAGATGAASAPVPAAGGALTAQAPVRAPKPSAQAVAGGSVVQLGAFPDQSSANEAWGRLSKRFAYLAPLGKSVEPVDVNGKTFYRLRVNAGSAGQASQLCGKLKVAGEACYIP